MSSSIVALKAAGSKAAFAKRVRLRMLVHQTRVVVRLNGRQKAGSQKKAWNVCLWVDGDGSKRDLRARMRQQTLCCDADDHASLQD
jgi:hypothetical protein